jgi:WD40 repeat protein
MARIFISHSSANNAEALALRDWLVARGWDDLFLDIDPHRGLVSGQRWLDRLQESAQRCKAVLFVLSREWLASRYCTAEFWEARKEERPLFAVVIDATAVAEVPAEMCGVWQLAFLTRGSRFETFSVLPPPDYVPTPVRFSHEGLESLRLGLSLAGLTSFDTESFPWPAPSFEHEADGTTPRRPYRGLKPVDVPDAGVFFGRDADLVRARNQLADLRDRGGRCLVAILGASGSGKSSFLRAGLLPRLARDDRHFLPLPVLRPRGAALWGDEGLLAALETAHRKVNLAVTRAELRKDLEEGGTDFLRRLADLRSAATRGLEKDAQPPTLVVPIDQGEELFTTVRGETGTTEAGLFLVRLAQILRHGPEAIALVTIRSDAYEPLQTAEVLSEVPQVPLNLPPLAAANYRSVIEGPADRASEAGRPLAFEPGLTEMLLADALGADALPLLGFTLERLYVEHGGDGDLTLADYETLGGVQGSIEAAVAEAFADPDAAPRIPTGAAEREALLKRAFVPHLMGVNEANGEPVRRTARLADLPAEMRGLIDRLVNRRLLVVDQRAKETVIEVAHEALLRLWPTLRRWHDQERAALEILQEVVRAASAWKPNVCGFDSAWLTHRGARLTEAEAVAHREGFAKVFEGVPRAYLDACRQAEDTARDAEARRLDRQRAMQRRVGFLLMVLATVTLVGGWLVMARQREVARRRSQLIATSAKGAFDAGHYDSAMRLALVASQDTWFAPASVDAGIQLGHATHFSRLEAILTGHKGAVMSASFSPDGERIVSASKDGTARVWSQGREGAWHSVSLEGHQGLVFSAIFSPEGKRVLTASEDGTARVWSQDKDGAWHSIPLKGHQGPVFSAVFSPDGTRILTASGDGTARVWSHDEGGEWHSVILKGHQFGISSAVFSPDGTRIVTGSTGNTARLWSRGTDDAWHSIALEGHHGWIRSPSFSPSGTRIVTASEDSTARVWSKSTDGKWRSVVLSGHTAALSSATFTSDGDIVTASWDKTVGVWNRGENGEWHRVILTGHQNTISSVSIAPDGTIVTASLDKTTRVWGRGAPGGWNSLALTGHRGQINSAGFSPDGSRIVTAAEDGTARVWSLSKYVTLEGHQGAVNSAAFSPDGMHIVTASSDKTARVWSHGKDGAWTSIALKGHQGAVHSAAFSLDGARIITASDDCTARMWKQGENGAWHMYSSAMDHQAIVFSAAFSSDGKRIVTTPRNRAALVWSRGKNGAWSSVTLEGHKEPVVSASFSPNGALIVTASWDKTARVWAQGRRGVWTSTVLVGHEALLNSASFSPDSAQIVTASWDKTARVWTPSKIGAWSSVALEGHQLSVTSAAFSPDGTRIATASADNTVRFWGQGEDGAWTSVTPAGHQSLVTSVAFSPEGTHIVTASWDRTARIWDIRWLMGPGDWAKTEPLSLPETVCREKLHGSWVTAKDPKTGQNVERIAERLLTADDIRAAPILAGHEGEDVCAPFLEPQPWWSRLAFWR